MTEHTSSEQSKCSRCPEKILVPQRTQDELQQASWALTEAVTALEVAADLLKPYSARMTWLAEYQAESVSQLGAKVHELLNDTEVSGG